MLGSFALIYAAMGKNGPGGLLADVIKSPLALREERQKQEAARQKLLSEFLAKGLLMKIASKPPFLPIAALIHAMLPST